MRAFVPGDKAASFVVENLARHVKSVVVRRVANVGELDLGKTADRSDAVAGSPHVAQPEERHGRKGDDDDDGHKQFGKRESSLGPRDLVGL